jgi:transcriptional regulator with XRE-family HTH domain
MDVSTAVKRLRESTGLSQQAFATEMGLSIRAVANYEKDRTPEREVLVRFMVFAMKHNQPKLADIFSAATTKDLDPIKKWSQMGRLIEEVLPVHRSNLRGIIDDLRNQRVDPEIRISEAIEKLEIIESAMGRNFSRYLPKREASE